jgi:DNA invertase Pin-like site-specific DNA recombinase
MRICRFSAFTSRRDVSQCETPRPVMATKAASADPRRLCRGTGREGQGRAELALLLVTRIDRLARSIKDLQDIVAELRAKGVALRATEQPIDADAVRRLKAEGMGAAAIARHLGIGRASVYRLLAALAIEAP